MITPKWLSTMVSFALVVLIFVAYFTMGTPKKNPVVTSTSTPQQTQIINTPSFTHKIVLGEKEIMVADAKMDSERILGLSDTAPLRDNEGMLFWFGVGGATPFWMKDMNYSLDIIWIASNYTVSEITPNVSPDTYPEMFSPKERAWYVLELPAGFAEKNNITVGTPVTF